MSFLKSKSTVNTMMLSNSSNVLLTLIASGALQMTTDGELAPMQKAVPADLQGKIEPCFSLRKFI